jgi:hypothetical protein
MVDEMDLLGRMKDAASLPDEAFGEARATLRATMADNAHPEPGSRRARGDARKGISATRGRIGLGVGAAAAAAAVAVALTVTSSPVPRHLAAPSGTGRPAPGAARSVQPTANPRLTQLAAYIEVHEVRLPGNASLEIRNQSAGNAMPGASGVDLLTDSGDYYWALTESGLPQAIAEHQDPSDGMFRREMAAALFAVNGNIATARERMAVASLAPGVKPKSLSPTAAVEARDKKTGVKYTPPKALTPGQQADNQIWPNCLDALNAGAGNPRIRAGVFRLLSTVPGVTITNSTTDGQPTLTLTQTWSSPSGPAQEVLVINASTGLPVVSMTRQPGGQTTGVTYYHVYRVTLADIAAGKF